MKILILGGSGMLGHQLARHFSPHHETWVTLRRPPGEFRARRVFGASHVVSPLDVTDRAAVARLMGQLRPDVVLNCIGLIKQLKEAKSAIPSITVNALLPHQLAEDCAAVGARLVLFSTDCVFSGRRGGYTEADVADAEDLYGRTKLLGEVVDQPHVVTLRSSIIGREVGTTHSLIDWFLSQSGGRVRGYRRAIYSGFTTLEMGRIVERVLLRHPDLAGLWHAASNPINKYDLLQLVRTHYDVPIEIEPYDEFVCDRSLNGARFAAATGYTAPDWNTMIAEMAATPE